MNDTQDEDQKVKQTETDVETAMAVPERAILHTFASFKEWVGESHWSSD